MTNALCRDDFYFHENGDVVLFRAFHTIRLTDQPNEAIITNIAHVTKIPTSSSLKRLAEDLNKSYEKIKNLNENVEDI